MLVAWCNSCIRSILTWKRIEASECTACATRESTAQLANLEAHQCTTYAAKESTAQLANVEAHQCTTYATREYTAQLTNLPAGYEYTLDACRVTPLEIRGVSHMPKRCEEHVSTFRLIKSNILILEGSNHHWLLGRERKRA